MTNDKQIEPNHGQSGNITQDALAQLGDGRIAYVKTIRSEDVPTCFRRRQKSRRASSCSRCMRPTARRSC